MVPDLPEERTVVRSRGRQRKLLVTAVIVLIAACHGPEDADDTAPEKTYECVAVAQVAPDGTAPSGYEYCTADSKTGFYHRVEAVDVAIDPYGDPDDPCFPEGMSAECKTNSDCKEGGVCQTGYWGGCECVDKCRTDDDCGPGNACIPDFLPLGKEGGGMGGSNQCVAANCLTDTDCPSGWCVLDSGPCGPAWTSALRCFGTTDECRTDSDCTDGKSCYSMGGSFVCDYHWSCG